MRSSLGRTWKFTWILLAALGCVDQPDDEVLEPEDQDPVGSEEGKFETWNSANNPAYVDATFIQYAHQLPVRGGRETAPVPGDYWGHYKDSINVKWDGVTSLSPSEKYARAFGRTDTQELVSRAYGVKSAEGRKACTTDSDCSDQMDGSDCATSFDGAVKRCIPTWWGICPGWAAWALTEPVPTSPVTRQASDGTPVTFYPGDLEGLMSMVYTSVSTKFISSRCNKKDPPSDANGRPIDGECRDMNPGTWHVVTTNLMGLRKQGFVLDQTWDDQVWNQPGWEFRVTNAVGDQLKEVTKEEAIDLLGIVGSLTALVSDRTIAKDAFETGSFLATAAGVHTLKMTGTGDADLYVRKGSAPTLSAYDCRPYEGGSLEECEVTLAAGETVHYGIHGYAADSKVSLGIAAPGAGAVDYIYNPSARKFYHVEMDFTFIVESSPARTSHIEQARSYSQTKRYEYILEADQYWKIVGGEWIGESRTAHPDFAWWPTGRAYAETAGIRYAEVKVLNDEAAGGVTPLPGRVTVIQDHAFGSSTYWRSKYAAVPVEPGVRQLKVTMTGTGDADLYVRRGQNPTIYTFNCSSATAGTSSETCTTDVSSTGGTYYVRARTRTPGTTVSVVVEKIQ